MDNDRIISEEILASPSLAPWHDALMLAKTKSFPELFPKKYQASMVDMAEEKTYKLLKEQPTLSLKETLTSVLNAFTTELSGELILKMTQVIIERWEKSAQTVHQTEAELEAV
jgi:hypothetical protein